MDSRFFRELKIILLVGLGAYIFLCVAEGIFSWKFMGPIGDFFGQLIWACLSPSVLVPVAVAICWLVKGTRPDNTQLAGISVFICAGSVLLKLLGVKSVLGNGLAKLLALVFSQWLITILAILALFFAISLITKVSPIRLVKFIARFSVRIQRNIATKSRKGKYSKEEFSKGEECPSSEGEFGKNDEHEPVIPKVNPPRNAPPRIEPTFPDDNDGAYRDAMSAMSNLGFKKKEIVGIMERIKPELASTPPPGVEEIVKLALRQSSR